MHLWLNQFFYYPAYIYFFKINNKNVIDVGPVFLLLTLNIFLNFF